MAIFNSYVKLPEGILFAEFHVSTGLAKGLVGIGLTSRGKTPLMSPKQVE